MADKHLVPLLLPADPTADLEAVTKQYVDQRSPITYVHVPTGTASIDKVYLANAISDTPAGGKIILANGGSTPYATDVPLVINKDLSIEGAGLVTAVTFSNGETPLASPYLKGPVILQTAAATDGIQITNVNAHVNLKNIGVRFDNPGSIAFTNTGHGINVDPGASANGLSNATWENIFVFGHDGNHYAFRFIAPLLDQFFGLRSFGGGLLYISGQSGVASGNLVFVHPFGSIFCAGTAHGVGISSAATGDGGLGLLTWIRPQVNENNFSAYEEYSNPTAPTSAQYLWIETLGAGVPGFNNIHDGDVEPIGEMSYPTIGAETHCWGYSIFPENLKKLAIGQSATAGEQATSLGYLAKADGIQSVAVGSGARAWDHLCTAIGHGASAAGVGAVAIGADSSWGTAAVANGVDYYVHGTELHKHFIPGLPTTDPALAGQLWRNNGVLAVSGSSIALAESQVTNLVTDLADKAALASPALTGNPTAPTQTGGDNSTKLATTAYVDHAPRIVQIQVTDPAGTALTVGDGKAYFRIPAAMNLMTLTEVTATVTTVSSSGIPTFQIANVTGTYDHLSTKLTVDASETDSATAANAAVIDVSSSHAIIHTADLLRIDCDVAGTGTKGVIISMTFI